MKNLLTKKGLDLTIKMECYLNFINGLTVNQKDVMNNMDDHLQFQSMDSWKGSGGGKFGLTFKQIILMHVNKCVSNGSIEFTGGYWRTISYNPIIKEYQPDALSVYCNSVKMLRAILLGYFDDKMIEEDKRLKEEFESSYEEFQKEKEEDDNKIDELRSRWREYKIEYYTELFEHLIMLSKRLNFFEEKSSEGDV